MHDAANNGLRVDRSLSLEGSLLLLAPLGIHDGRVLLEGPPRPAHARRRLDDGGPRVPHGVPVHPAQPSHVDAQHRARGNPGCLRSHASEQPQQLVAHAGVRHSALVPAYGNPAANATHEMGTDLLHVAGADLVERGDAAGAEEEARVAELVEVARNFESIEDGGGKLAFLELELRNVLGEHGVVARAHLGVADARGIAMLEHVAALQHARVAELGDSVVHVEDAGLHLVVGLDAPDEVAARRVELADHRVHLAKEL
mmetsp:Transcript_29875/g.64273  ORF Transcript_29875/g.64273 Transcript_29875/m.64273 type:complete len:257 (+) Transcript_29875:1020-1790(+)